MRSQTVRTKSALIELEFHRDTVELTVIVGDNDSLAEVNVALTHGQALELAGTLSTYTNEIEAHA